MRLLKMVSTAAVIGSLAWQQRRLVSLQQQMNSMCSDCERQISEHRAQPHGIALIKSALPDFDASDLRVSDDSWRPPPLAGLPIIETRYPLFPPITGA